MRRRAFLFAAGTLWLATALAQSKREQVVVGWLHFGSREDRKVEFAAFKAGMRALGWDEGAQYVLEERWADDSAARLPALAAEIAARNPAVIVAIPNQAVSAALRSAPRIPIVMGTGVDPVASGFAASLARPGGMVTGLSNISSDLSDKIVELLLSAAPKLRRVGFLIDSNSNLRQQHLENASRISKMRSLEGKTLEVAAHADIGPVLARFAADRVQALVLTASPLVFGARHTIAAEALKQRWPVIGFRSEFADAGTLLSYGPDFAGQVQRAATFVDKILKGAKPGDLPFEQPTRIEFVTNLRTAKALGLTLPQTLLLRADRVIE